MLDPDLPLPLLKQEQLQLATASFRDLSQFSRRSIRRRLCARRLHQEGRQGVFHDPTRIVKPTEEFGQGVTQRLDQRGIIIPGDITMIHHDPTAIWSKPPANFEQQRTASQTDDPTKRIFGDQWTSAGGCTDDG